ncbi:MAG: hypothetical protein ACREBD_21775, partial [Blastocatellia bacterium]
MFKFKGLAFGAECALSPKEVKGKPITYTYHDLSGKENTWTYAANGVKGWGSLNLSYHVKEITPSGKLAPFVTAGVTIFARDGLAEATNYGGGVSFWRNRHRGWRLEYRKYVIDDGSYNSRFRALIIVSAIGGGLRKSSFLIFLSYIFLLAKPKQENVG